MRITLLLTFFLFSVFPSSGEVKPDESKIFIYGADFQKDAKLEIFFNGNRIAFLAKGLEIQYSIHEMGELMIQTQAYNMIDAKYGPPMQLKLNIEPGKDYHLSAKYTKSSHLTLVGASEVDKITKGGKKITSTIELSDQ